MKKLWETNALHRKLLNLLWHEILLMAAENLKKIMVEQDRYVWSVPMCNDPSKGLDCYIFHHRFISKIVLSDSYLSGPTP